MSVIAGVSVSNLMYCRSSAIKLLEHALLNIHTQVLHGRKLYTIHGGIANCSELMRTMCHEPKVVSLITVGIGGTGHNFQHFNAVYFMDRLWNPQVSKTMFSQLVFSLVRHITL